MRLSVRIRGFANAMLILFLVSLPALGLAVEDGVYTGTTSQGRAISLTVSGGVIDERSISYSCGFGATTVFFSDCAIEADGSFSCGNASCPASPYGAYILISGTFSGNSVSGSLDVTTFPCEFACSCCYLTDGTFTASSIQQLPDLQPYQPSGWDSKIVISKVTGTNTTASTIYDDEPIYVDYSCANFGDGDAGSFRYGIYIDDTRVAFAEPASLNAGTYSAVLDSSRGILSAGTHTFKVVCDYNFDVSESDENNNEYSRSFTITARTEPQVSIGDVVVTEGNTGTTSAQFDVTMSFGVNEVVTVDWDTADGTANSTDYIPASGTVTFSSQQTAKTVNVLVYGDTDEETNEVFYVDLSNPVNAEIDDSRGQCTITDDDSSVVETLYDQTDNPAGSGQATQDFETLLDDYDSEMADDFTVPATGWQVTRVGLSGFYSVDGGPAEDVNLWFYPDQGGLPGDTAVCSYQGIVPTVNNAGSLISGDITIDLPEACVLSPGIHWLAAQIRMDNDPNGVIYLLRRTVQSGNEAVWRNPGDGFGTGAIDWTSLTEIHGDSYPDMIFLLAGQEGSTESADLEIATIAVDPNPAYLDQSFTITATINNVGTGSATSRLIEYYMSTDSTITGADCYLGSDNVTLAAGAGGSETITMSPLSSAGCVSPGTYYIGISIPAETENWVRTASIEVLEGGTPDIRIQPTSLTFDNPAPATQSVGFDSSTTTPDFMRLISKADATGSVRVIVGLDLDTNAEGYLKTTEVADQRLQIRNVQDTFLARISGQKLAVAQFATIPYLSLELSAAQLSEIANFNDVVSIQEDIPEPPDLASSNAVIGSAGAWAAGFDGTGFAVAVLDTGVDSSHSFFTTGGDRVISEACYSSNNSSSSSVCPGGVSSSIAPGSGINCDMAAEGCDHGTHVAGIVAGNDGSGPNYGVARGSEIIAVQVFSRFDEDIDCSPSAAPCVHSWVTDQILGLERVLALSSTYNIAAVNMSLGGGYYTSQATCDAAQGARKAAIDNLRSVGIATVASSGNEGYTDGTGAPGCISSAISVGATSDSDDITSFSNIASFLDLLAPGEFITSSVPGEGLDTWGGTSMSAPHVAGAWAVLKQKSSAASVDVILEALRATGASVNDQRSGGTVTDMRRINVDLALAQLDTDPSDTFTIYNDGTSSLDIEIIDLESPASWISWSPPAPFTVAAGSSRVVTVSVNFAGAPLGSTFNRLLVSSNDQDESPYPDAVLITVNNTDLTCYALTRDHTGQGADPSASPPNSQDCPTGEYIAGEAISLTADPGVGWSVVNWTGTDNDGSNSVSNSVTMPASARTVTVHYIDDGQNCHLLTREHTGQGADPSASPPNSQDCPAGEYIAGETISLTASPGVGWSVGSWTGTDNDGSTSISNAVTMPASIRTVIVNYLDGGNCSALRGLPAGYAPDQAFTVTVEVTPDGLVQVYAVEDSPPVDWPVSDISDEGSFDAINDSVKWGPFFDNQARSLSYSVTPPTDSTGAYIFDGIASFDGFGEQICGDSEIEPGTVHPADMNDSWSMTINEVTAYGAAWKIGDIWPRPPNPIDINYVTNCGFLWKNGEAYYFDAGQNPPWVPGAPPGHAVSRVIGGTGISSFTPSEYTPEQPVQVSISVTPDSGVSNYAAEDAVPPGWVVTAISDSGVFDSVNGAVKWGPFFDDSIRELSYTVTPPGDASGSKTFSGQVSFDGLGVAITGDREIEEPEELPIFKDGFE